MDHMSSQERPMREDYGMDSPKPPRDTDLQAEVVAEPIRIEDVATWPMAPELGTDNLSVGALASETKGEKHPEYTFVYCEHTPDRAAEVAEAVRGCDIVAIEAAGTLSEQDRLKRGRDFTAFISSRFSAEQRAKLTGQLKPDERFIDGVLYQLAGSDKRIELLDIPMDDPDYKLVEREYELKAHLVAALRADVPNAQLRDMEHELTELSIEIYRRREEVVYGQLKTLATLPDVLDGTNIGVIRGIEHQMEQKTFNYGDQMKQVTTSTKYGKNYSEQIREQMRSGGKISPELLDRQVLTLIFMSRGYCTPTDRALTAGEKALVGDEIQEQIVSKMTDAEVASTLAQLDHIKTSRMNKFRKTASPKVNVCLAATYEEVAGRSAQS